MSGPEEEARYRAMVEFIGTFSSLSGNPPTDLSELSDGVALFEALSEIAPDVFEPATIARHLGDNWALKASNLRKLLRNLESFYHESLQKDADFSSHNLNKIAREGDRAAIADLVELVAAAAVTCDERTVFINRIMTMSTENQLQMKDILQQSMGRLVDYAGSDGGDDDQEDDDDDENELVFDGDDDEDSPKDASLFYGGKQGLELQEALEEARMELAAQKSQASILAQEHENAQQKLRDLVEDLQDRLMKRQNELIGAEEELRQVTANLEDSKATILELEESKAQLEDDLDVANAKADQLRKAEATVSAYRRKLEGAGAMNQQVTELEDQAASYLRQIMELEAEKKKIPTLQATIEELQSQVASLERDGGSTNTSLKASASEIAELKSKLVAAESAKKMYEEEVRELRAERESGVEHEVGTAMAGMSLADSSSLNVAKEKAARLEIENKTLMEQIEILKEQVASRPVEAAPAPVDSKPLKKEINRLSEELAAKEAEKQKISSDKDKLEAYTKRTLAKFQEKYLVALQECKAKLKEKQDKIEALESRGSSEKTAQKREERLLSSTIYELGLAIMQNKLKER